MASDEYHISNLGLENRKQEIKEAVRPQINVQSSVHLSISWVLFKKSVESVLNELNLLKCLKDDFLINALFAFQDR